MLDYKNKSQQGASVYLALMVMIILLAIAFGLSSIFLGQTKMVREIGNSVIAFYAADAGIEKVLMERTDPSNIPETTLSNQAKYEVFVYKGPRTSGGPEGKCTGADLHYCITSIGTYKETRRAIGIQY